MDLIARVRDRLNPEEWTGTRWVVAVSGGVDSMVLLRLLADLREDLDLRLHAVHVHHGLRSEADLDASHVAEAAASLGLSCSVRRVHPRIAREATSRDRSTLQERARRLRYQALGAVARDIGARGVATAHHADDQAETLLLRLFRGTGPDGAAAMAPARPWPEAWNEPGSRVRPPGDGAPFVLARPLLALRRSEILEFASAHGVSWREDASNLDPHYARNRLRHEWLPGLREAFNPRLEEALSRFAAALGEEREWIQGIEDAEAARRFSRERHGLTVDLKDWDDLPIALARRLLRRMLKEQGAGRDVSERHLERMLAFVAGRRARHGGKRLELPGGLVLRVTAPRGAPALRLERAALPPSAEC